ncbi:hypothetical protein D3C86_1409570 [compost metagenome]
MGLVDGFWRSPGKGSLFAGHTERNLTIFDGFPDFFWPIMFFSRIGFQEVFIEAIQVS